MKRPCARSGLVPEYVYRDALDPQIVRSIGYHVRIGVFVAFVSAGAQVSLNREHSHYEWLSIKDAIARVPLAAQARRIVRALRLPPAATADDYLVAQEIFIGFLGSELLDYEAGKTGDDAFEIRVRRCFAHENVMPRAGVDDFSRQPNSS